MKRWAEEPSTEPEKSQPEAICAALQRKSNPFSLGIIGQYFTNNEFILLCLTQISIFKIWAVVLQFKYIKELIESTAKRTALYVIGFNIVILLIVTFFTMMDLEKLL